MPRPAHIDPDIHGRCAEVGVDEAIARLAERQFGRVSRRQLLDLGVGRGAIDWRVHLGRLRLVHHGVYAVGHRVQSTHARWMAAVLAAGGGARLSFRSAGALWDVRAAGAGVVDVTAPARRRRPGIRIHVARLPDDEVAVHHDIPVTTPARTLLDLAGVLQPAEIERALERAEQLRLADRTPLDALLKRYPNRTGTAALREILKRGVRPVGARSELETAFLVFLDAHGLPRPVVNGLVEGKEVDFTWPAARLIVEVDGRETHLTAAAFERDRERDRRLAAAGWRVVRITWRQLHERPAAVARDLRALLGPALA